MQHLSRRRFFLFQRKMILKKTGGFIRIFSNRAVILFKKIGQDNVFTHAAALAYFTALSIAPMVLLLIAFLSFMQFDLQEQFLVQVRELIGAEASQVFEAIIDAANRRLDLSRAAGWVGAGLLIFSASVVFAELQSALNIIFRADTSFHDHLKDVGFLKRFIKQRLLSAGILLSFIFISIVSLIVSTVLSYFTSSYELGSLKFISAFLNLSIYAILFGLLYRWMPDRSVRPSNYVLGGFLTALMFVLGKTAIGVYIGKTAVGSAYGAAGSLIVLLVWIYYSALIFFLGAEISSLYLVRNRNA